MNFEYFFLTCHLSFDVLTKVFKFICMRLSFATSFLIVETWKVLFYTNIRVGPLAFFVETLLKASKELHWIHWQINLQRERFGKKTAYCLKFDIYNSFLAKLLREIDHAERWFAQKIRLFSFCYAAIYSPTPAISLIFPN